MFVQELQHPRCECHECTQARWKMSLGGQLSGALQQPWPPVGYKLVELPPNSFVSGITTTSAEDELLDGISEMIDSASGKMTEDEHLEALKSANSTIDRAIESATCKH